MMIKNTSTKKKHCCCCCCSIVFGLNNNNNNKKSWKISGFTLATQSCRLLLLSFESNPKKNVRIWKTFESKENIRIFECEEPSSKQNNHFKEKMKIVKVMILKINKQIMMMFNTIGYILSLSSCFFVVCCLFEEKKNRIIIEIIIILPVESLNWPFYFFFYYLFFLFVLFCWFRNDVIFWKSWWWWW